MPRRFSYRGERLALNAGIIALAVLATAVVLPFGGRVETLIPLYAIGVFTAFTLSQTGMVRHWMADRQPGWRRSAVINGIGALATGCVAIVFVTTKSTHGAWVVLIIVPTLVGLAAADRLRSQFARQVPDVTLVTVESPFRELVEPLIRFLEVTAANDRSTVTVVLLPERLIRHWWERPLFNQNAHRIRDALTGHEGLVVANVPYRRA